MLPENSAVGGRPIIQQYLGPDSPFSALMSDADFSVRSGAPHAVEDSVTQPSTMYQGNSCAMSSLSLRVSGMHTRKGTLRGFRDPLLLRQHHMANVGIPGSVPCGRGWGGDCMFVGREKGEGNFALSSFKHTLLPLGLPLPCLTHKHIYNVYTHPLCVDQYSKFLKILTVKLSM